MQAEETPAAAGFREHLVRALLGLINGVLSNATATRRSQSNVQVVVGIFLLIFGYWIGRDHCRLILFGVRTQGKLIGYQEERFASGTGSTFQNTASMPIVAFQAEGHIFRFKDWMGSNFRVPMGGLVPVLYDPLRPTNAMIDRPVWNWIPWAPMMGVGCFLVIVGTTARLQIPQAC